MSTPRRSRRPPLWGTIAVALMSLAYAAQFTAWGVHRYEIFTARRFDLGNMTQAVWSAAHGHLLISTDVFGDQVTRFAGHVEPILFLFAPLWWIWPSPLMLVVAQAIAVATTAIPAYLLGRLWLGSTRLAVLFAGVTLMYPVIQAQTLFDFHPVALATPLIMWAIWAAATNRNLLLAVTVVLALMTKEQVGLAVFVFGLWIVFALGRRRAGALVAGAGLTWSAIAIGVILPHFRTPAAEAMLVARYGEFGDSVGSAIVNLVLHPATSFDLLVTHTRVAFVLALLIPLLFLSLRAPLLSAGAVPELFINLMSSHTEQHRVAYHYGAVIAPFLIAGAIRGLGSLRASPRAWARSLTREALVIPLVIVVTLVSSYFTSPLPFWGPAKMLRATGVDRQRELLAQTPSLTPVRTQAVRMIPPDVVVSAGNGFGAHLSARRRILTFPFIGDAEWVIVDRTYPAMYDALDARALRERVDRLIRNPAYRVVFAQRGVVVIRRVKPL